MTAVELFRKNKRYLEANGFICRADMADVRHVSVTEDEEGFAVVLDHEKNVYIYKSGDFQYEEFFQKKRLEIHDLRCVNVLKALNVVTRETRYCGFDNYIYLIYESQDTLAALACVVDLSVMLNKNKFKVCIGEQIREDTIQNNIGTDGRKELQIEEMNNLVFLYQTQNSGGYFLRDVITQGPYLVFVDCGTFHQRTEQIEGFLGKSGKVKSAFLDRTRLYSGDEVKRNIRKMLRAPSLFRISSKTLRYMEKVVDGKENLKASDIMKAFCIAEYYSKNEKINHRIVPVIMYFPDHYLKYLEYFNEIRKDFLHVAFFRTVRHPVIRSIRAYSALTKFCYRVAHWNKPLYLISLIRTLGFAPYLNVLFEEFYFDEFSVHSGYPLAAVRFEDLKTNPQKYMPKVCEYLGIPYEEKLIQNEEIFRPGAVSPSIDKEVFTDTDVKILQAMYHEIMEHYGYENLVDGTIDIDSMKNDDIRFTFETAYSKLIHADYEQVHKELINKFSQAKERNFTPSCYPLWIK